RRIASPSLLSRESTTLSCRWPQNGHFIILFRCCCPEVLQGQTMGDHVHAASQDGWNVLRYPCYQRRSDRLLCRHAEKSRHAEYVSRLKTAANSRNLRNGTNCCSNHDQRCR